MTDELIKRLRLNCIWQRRKGTSRDNGYPYRKHVQDCDICQGADRIAELEGFERIVKMSGQNAGLRLMNAEEKIKRLDAALARLSDKKLFLPLIKVMSGLGPQVNWAKEFDARIEFAKKERAGK